jgi:K+-sensing histidine kinase KdpD
MILPLRRRPFQSDALGFAAEPGVRRLDQRRLGAAAVEFSHRQDALPVVRGDLDLLGQVFKPKGLGLGLPLAKRILERHGGTLAIASTAGAGTAVTLRFLAAV